jgi:hypothetical protein
MKKIYAFFTALLITGALSAQVNVTYMVDITNYLAAGNVLGANGIRVGGDFGATAGMNGAAAMAVWTPSDPTCALVDMGGNVWGITVTYPTASVGLTQYYKFVNNDWGTNEGTDPGNTIGAEGCGVDDGAGNVNRTLVIPDADIMYLYCWDACYRCDGSDPVVLSVEDYNAISGLSVSPNPALTNTNINFNLSEASDVTISVYNLMGQEIMTVNNGTQSAGNHSYSLDMTSMPAGNYVYHVVAGNSVTSGNIVKL